MVLCFPRPLATEIRVHRTGNLEIVLLKMLPQTRPLLGSGGFWIPPSPQTHHPQWPSKPHGVAAEMRRGHGLLKRRRVEVVIID